MKRFLIYIVGIGLLLTACDIEHSDNGDLDGFWQMTSYSNKSAASVSDMRSSGITWAFQGRILELRDVQNGNQDIIMSFKHDEGTLNVFSPYLVERDSGDIQISKVELLMPYGINGLEDSFSVLELSSNSLIIENEKVRLQFRKY